MSQRTVVIPRSIFKQTVSALTSMLLVNDFLNLRMVSELPSPEARLISAI
jgi:hypothetical protein